MNLHTLHINPDTLLEKAGYTRLPNGSYIRYDEGGRFHAYVRSKSSINFHYDVYVSKNSRSHFSLPMPRKMSEELTRLKGMLDTTKRVPTVWRKNKKIKKVNRAGLSGIGSEYWEKRKKEDFGG